LKQKIISFSKSQIGDEKVIKIKRLIEPIHHHHKTVPDNGGKGSFFAKKTLLHF